MIAGVLPWMRRGFYGRSIVTVLLLLATKPGASLAQMASDPSRVLDVKAVLGRSIDHVLFAVEGGVAVGGPFEAIALLQRVGITFDILTGRVLDSPRPFEPSNLRGWSAGGGLRMRLLRKPRSFLALVVGRHRYTDGEVNEDTPFVGAGLGQSVTLGGHLDLGWEVRGQRMSGYVKERVVNGYDVTYTLNDVHQAHYLFVFGVSLGGVL